MPSSPWRCSAVASTSQRRTSARSRYSAAQLVVADVERVVGVLDALALGREQLDEVRLLREVGGGRPGYGVDHLGRLVQRSHRRSPRLPPVPGSPAGRVMGRVRGAGVWRHSHMVARHPVVDNTTPEPICARSPELIAQNCALVGRPRMSD